MSGVEALTVTLVTGFPAPNARPVVEELCFSDLGLWDKDLHRGKVGGLQQGKD